MSVWSSPLIHDVNSLPTINSFVSFSKRTGKTSESPHNWATLGKLIDYSNKPVVRSDFSTWPYRIISFVHWYLDSQSRHTLVSTIHSVDCGSGIQVQALLPSGALNKRRPPSDQRKRYSAPSAPNRFQIQVIDLLGISEQSLLCQTDCLSFVDVVSLDKLRQHLMHEISCRSALGAIDTTHLVENFAALNGGQIECLRPPSPVS